MIQFTNTIDKFNKIILSELKENGITCWIAGGALRNHFMGINLRTDYDIFFPSELEYEKTKNYLLQNSGIIKWDSNNGTKISYKNKTFDLVKKYFRNAITCIYEFDFTISMFSIDTDGNFYQGETAFIDLSKRQLMINKITYPASTLSRAFKYYKNGFSMCQSEMKKIILSIQSMEKEITNESTPAGEPDNLSSADSMFNGID